MQLNIFSALTLLLATGASAQIVPDRYIVKLSEVSRSSYDSQIDEIESLISTNQNARSYGTPNEIRHKYQKAHYGFSAQLDSTGLELVKNHPNVESVRPVRMMKLYRGKRPKVEDNSPWGLARLSSNAKLAAAPYQYKYDENGGKDVTVYVIDTGINIAHEEFEGRARWGVTIVKNATNTDNNGHGTHCAGTIGSKTFGVAKKVNLVAVKVYDTNDGPDEDMLAGIEWVLNNADLSKNNVISMSLGADYPEDDTASYIDEAVSRAVDDGIVVVVAAGNETKDACLGSPARAPKVITVGATTVDDELAYYSNFGKCVDILAPGSRVLSTWIGSTNATNTISGTSMATPHVAGLSAVLLSQGATPWSVPNKLKQLSIKNAITKVPAETVNYLAHYPGK
ncbi:subtilisin-like protein [Conidiobolus coronatus NRRL 28638]|uniref:Subtilisin-like protein n=1 Tax=Conidiobolus coronatus (strain ATCC 28846 / CBS 209.66 / NRRL 28638) TaxID=796925 RepID=A0A137NUJ4_CONC2|nr:subtilisin-like protein [Conidiobolus coronatus NRRL 28638]|eukprot:KXN66392.1 subtilisin-like protein [Conidiobolus coronatus NRRL 28638]